MRRRTKQRGQTVEDVVDKVHSVCMEKSPNHLSEGYIRGGLKVIFGDTSNLVNAGVKIWKRKYKPRKKEPEVRRRRRRT